MTEEEILKVYHNPSKKNNDTPPGTPVKTSQEQQAEKAYLLETQGK
jgi:hypothetical protein